MGLLERAKHYKKNAANKKTSAWAVVKDGASLPGNGSGQDQDEKNQESDSSAVDTADKR